MNGEKLDRVELENEMKSSYIDYAMSVIISRAIPDVRDGLKPVHRRILYAMDNIGLGPSAPFRKSATIVGDVIGKYHPHGDASVYDAAVRLAQSFNMRYPLIQGQGNFGSIDGDPAAAYRYTEARMTHAAMKMLEDLDMDTVDFADNFDASLKEPSVLPSKLPNLLINGSSGIAVGMATNIPPHNLSDVADAALRFISDPSVSDEELANIVKGPDFPSGGIIMGQDGCRKAYMTGKGIITLRARTEYEKMKRHEAIVVTEIPYQVNKSRLVEQIAEGIKKGIITNISDLRDESDKSGVRIVIELSSGANRQVVMNQLFKHSNLQISYGMTMLALVGGEPKFLSLKDMISCWMNHRREVVKRRTAFLLKKDRERAEILEALLLATDEVDRIIAIIRSCRKRHEAELRICSEMQLTKRQAVAILDMRLESLMGMERNKLDREYVRIRKEIASLEKILAGDEALMNVIRKEINEIKAELGDSRKTEIALEAAENPDIENLIPEEPVAVMLMNNGFIKRAPIGKRGPQAQEPDAAIRLETTTHCRLLIFTDAGKAYGVKIHEIPESGRQSRGMAAINIASLSPEEKPVFIMASKDFASEKGVILSASSGGYLKKTEISMYASARKSGAVFMKLDGGDKVIMCRYLAEGDDCEFMTLTEGACAYLCRAGSLEPSGKGARGRKFNAKQEGDRVSIILDNPGYGKELVLSSDDCVMCRISMNQFRLPSKVGKAIQVMKNDYKSKPVSHALTALKDDTLVVLFEDGVSEDIAVKDIDTASKSRKGRRMTESPGRALSVSVKSAGAFDKEI